MVLHLTFGYQLVDILIFTLFLFLYSKFASNEPKFKASFHELIPTDYLIVFDTGWHIPK